MRLQSARLEAYAFDVRFELSRRWTEGVATSRVYYQRPEIIEGPYLER